MGSPCEEPTEAQELDRSVSVCHLDHARQLLNTLGVNRYELKIAETCFHLLIFTSQ